MSNDTNYNEALKRPNDQDQRPAIAQTNEKQSETSAPVRCIALLGELERKRSIQDYLTSQQRLATAAAEATNSLQHLISVVSRFRSDSGDSDK